MAGLYVHVPFRRTEPPTDEGDAVVTDAADVSRFETALSRELTYYAREYAAEEQMSTLYAGGGRPSLLPLSSVHGVLRTFVDVFDTSSFEEATAEVSPADATPRYLSGLKRMGFDRLSLPVLSFFPGTLQALDAPHSSTQAMRALDAARNTGFAVSIDLWFGGPDQALDTWAATLRQAVERRIPHVTIIEAPPNGGNEDDRADKLELAMSLLQSEGYEQYELTHFARPGHRSAHQEHYYDHGNYIGVGPAAQSFWWPARTASSPARRWENVSDPERYARLLRQRYPPVAYRETLDSTALAQEYVLLALRTDTGLDLTRLQEDYGVDLRTRKADMLGRLHEEGLIHDDADAVRLTPQGRLVTDAITERLLPS